MIDRLHADNAAGGFAIMARQMRGQFRFGAVRASNQDRLCLGDRHGDSCEKIVVQQGSAASTRASVVVDVPRRTVGVEDHPIDSGRIEMEELCFPLIDPDNRMKRARHWTELALEADGSEAS
ncbi:MAG: hypothetical protein WAK01_03740 [Methylocystis sp.]